MPVEVWVEVKLCVGVGVCDTVEVDVGVDVRVEVLVEVPVEVPVAVAVEVLVVVGDWVAVEVHVVVKVKVLVGVDVVVGVGVDVQAASVVVTGLETWLTRGKAVSPSALFTRLTPQAFTVPATVKAPVAPPARFPRFHTTCCPFIAGAPLLQT